MRELALARGFGDDRDRGIAFAEQPIDLGCQQAMQRSAIADLDHPRLCAAAGEGLYGIAARHDAASELHELARGAVAAMQTDNLRLLQPYRAAIGSISLYAEACE